jgi:Carboxypeptidase regulatory-like domain
MKKISHVSDVRQFWCGEEALMDFKRFVRVAIVALFWSAGSSPQALAQGVGAIGGTVTDESGAVLPGATVTLSNPGVIGGNQSTVSDGQGAYQFTRLLPGRYGVKAELTGFRTVLQENIDVNADKTSRADLKLAVGELSEQMTITADAPLLDTTSALNQTVMTRQVLDSLPARNDIWSIARMAPAVTMARYDVGGSESYAQYQSRVHGSSQGENYYMIDGMDTSNPNNQGGGTNAGYYDPFMMSEINYQTGQVPAERPTGGVITNMITKTGTNVVHGSYMYSGLSSHAFDYNNVSPQLRKDLLSDVPAIALAADPNLKPGAAIKRMWDTAATISGPILRDRLWYAGSVRYGVLDQYRLGQYNPNGQQVLDDNVLRNAAVKGSWQMTKDSQLHVLYHWNNRAQFHRGSLGTLAESRVLFRSDQYTHTSQGRWTDVLSSRMVVDVSASLMHSAYGGPAQPEVQIGDIPRRDAITGALTVADAVYSWNPDWRLNAIGSLSYVVGHHDLKVGYWFNRGNLEYDNWSYSDYPAGLRAVYRSGVPDSVNTYNTPTKYAHSMHDNSIYAQDKWTPMRKLTLNLGVRFEETYSWQDQACQVATKYIAGQCFPVPVVPDWKKVVPRLSAIYDMFGNGSTALKFSANRYVVSPGTSNTLNRINPIAVKSDTRAWTVCAAGQTSGCDLNGDLIPQLNELGPSTGFNLGTTNRYDPDIEWPPIDEISAEIERQLPAQLVVSAGYYHREVSVFKATNVAVPTSGYIPLQVTEKVSGRQVTVYNQDPATRGKFDVVFANDDQRDKFNGVDLTFQKRMSHRWMVMGGLSFGKKLGDIYGPVDLNNPNYTFRRGIVENDVPVSFKLSGGYQFPFGIMASGSYQHYSGFPENTTVLVNAATVALTQVSQSILVEPRATTRLPDVDLTDMSFRKTFRFGRLKAEPVLDAYNLFNASPTTSRTTQLGPAYGRVVTIVRGRLIKFGANVDW